MAAIFRQENQGAAGGPMPKMRGCKRAIFVSIALMRQISQRIACWHTPDSSSARKANF
jgi:hypothetical protein